MNTRCLLPLLLSAAVQTVSAAPQTDSGVWTETRYGITVSPCAFDMDKERFCTEKRMKTFAAVMKKRQPNFIGGLILYIYRSPHSVVAANTGSYRMVLIDPKKRTATPFYWAFNPAARPVDATGRRLVFEFDTQSSRFCVKGNIEAYRNAYDWGDIGSKPFCFRYSDEDGNVGFGAFEH